jgi:hypothetical protein
LISFTAGSWKEFFALAVLASAMALIVFWALLVFVFVMFG